VNYKSTCELHLDKHEIAIKLEPSGPANNLTFLYKQGFDH
jgi:hypothetical protein